MRRRDSAAVENNPFASTPTLARRSQKCRMAHRLQPGSFFYRTIERLRFPESARTYSVFHNFIRLFAERWSFCAAHQAEMNKGTASRFIFWFKNSTKQTGTVARLSRSSSHSTKPTLSSASLTTSMRCRLTAARVIETGTIGGRKGALKNQPDHIGIMRGSNALCGSESTLNFEQFTTDPTASLTLDRSQVLKIKDCKSSQLSPAEPTMNTITNEIRVMTSGAFTAAYLELIPRLELVTKKKIVTLATSIGTGENSIPNRLRRGEAVDVVIVADGVLVGFINDGLILAESYTPVARSAIGMAVRAGAPKPDIDTVEALKRTLLQAKSIAYSASVSGEYLTTELYQRLGIADQVMSKSRLIGGGERVGAVVARGEAEIGFQQMSELLPVPGIDHVTALPPEVQKVSVFSAGVARSTRDPDAAHAVVRFLASPEAARAIAKSGLEPIPRS